LGESLKGFAFLINHGTKIEQVDDNNAKQLNALDATHPPIKP